MTRGQCIHLGGPWWLVCSPDTGRVYYGKDYGRGVAEVPASAVPSDLRREEVPARTPLRDTH